MRALKISLVGFSADEQPLFSRLLTDTCPDPCVNFYPIHVEKNSRLLAECDFLILRSAEEPDWVEQFLEIRLIRHIYQPVMVVVDRFTPDIVIQLSNLGADRVVPVLKAGELIPACLQVFFPELCKVAMPQVREDSALYAFDGMSGITRLLRTEKLGLTFVERLLDILDAMVVVLSKDGAILFFNRKCEEITGYGLADVAGRNFADIFLLPEEKAQVM